MEKTGAGCVGLGGADRLLDGGELAVQDAGAGELFDVLEEAGAEAGERVEFFCDEQVVGGIEAPRADQLGVAEVAREPEVVGGPGGDRDPDARAVDLVDRRDRRARGYQVGGLDLGVGRRKRDRLGARRLGRDQADVPDVSSGRVGELARAWRR